MKNAGTPGQNYIRSDRSPVILSRSTETAGGESSKPDIKSRSLATRGMPRSTCPQGSGESLTKTRKVGGLIR